MRKYCTLFICLSAALLAVLLAACNRQEAATSDFPSEKADSIIFDAGAVKDYARMRELVDSFERHGVISPITANRWRGAAYYRQGQYRSAEYYLKRALECEVVTESDMLSYNKSARRLSELLLVKGDYEGALEVAMPAVVKMEETGRGSDIDFAILLNNIGCCQLNLGRDDEANASFLKARGHYAKRWETDSTGRGLQEAVIGTVYTSQAYINTRRMQESLYWIDRTEMLLNKYRTKPDARSEYFDEYQGRIYIMRAVALFELGKKADAIQAYRMFRETDYAQKPEGLIYANDFLLAAGRYSEASDNYRALDAMIAQRGIDMTLDNIQLYLIPKLRANIGAQRKDTVVAVAQRLCDALDSAIVKSKGDDTAELATIYETQQKEAQIAYQQADMARQRQVSTMIALALVVAFFSVFIFFRLRSAKRIAQAHERLEEAHASLQKAYSQLEETTAAKERIESELRIARDIQMSMLPHEFPCLDGLDLHACMETAKEVGGDLYGYMLEDELLYFCVGDVSGKGVPASLFMAQATRMFRTMAVQRMMPADIVTQLNAALTEDNEQGMFITMFLGMVNLKSGHLYFCNAGHNPPVLLQKDDNGKEARFLEMEPNAPIGLWPGLEFVGEEIENILNRPLVIYTDGLTEAENKRQEQFGEEHLLDILRSNRFASAQAVDEFLLEAVKQFRAGAEPNDDLTLLTLKVG